MQERKNCRFREWSFISFIKNFVSCRINFILYSFSLSIQTTKKNILAGVKLQKKLRIIIKSKYASDDAIYAIHKRTGIFCEKMTLKTSLLHYVTLSARISLAAMYRHLSRARIWLGQLSPRCTGSRTSPSPRARQLRFPLSSFTSAPTLSHTGSVIFSPNYWAKAEDLLPSTVQHLL